MEFLISFLILFFVILLQSLIYLTKCQTLFNIFMQDMKIQMLCHHAWTFKPIQNLFYKPIKGIEARSYLFDLYFMDGKRIFFIYKNSPKIQKKIPPKIKNWEIFNFFLDFLA